MTATQAEASHLINSDRTTAVTLTVNVGKKPHKCTYCRYEAAKASDLKIHITYVHDRKHFFNSRSNNCYSAANGRSMERGLTSMFKGLKLNEGEKPHNFTHCSYKGATASDLKMRKADVQKEKKPHNRLCETAEASGSGSAVTPMHRDLKINTRETPYVSLRSQFRADIAAESEMPNQCRLCGFRALTPFGFRAHVYECQKVHLCTHCTYIGTTASDLNMHIADVHKEKKPHNCTHCTYIGTTASDLNMHIADVHKEKKPHNRLCETAEASGWGSAVTRMYRGLKINTRKTPYVSLRSQFRADIAAESEMPNQCRLCGFRALTPVDFRAHVYECQNAHQCTHCTYKGTTASDLNMHIADVHKEKKPHNCTHCTYIGTTASDLNMHIVDVHKEKKPHNRLCETAEASVLASTVTRMYRGLKKNTRETSYVCMQCCYKSDIPAESEMPNKRRICAFEALTPVDFKTHVHDCPKAHQCTYCSYTTSSTSLMKKHARIIHKNTKPLKIYVHKSKTSHERCCQLRRAQDVKARSLEGKVTSMLGDLKLD